MPKLTIGLFNDSFPPAIDGVSNVTVNYAKQIQEYHGDAIVATPWYPNVKDDYPFEVIRYPSAYVNKKLGYRAGYPFDIKALYQLNKRKMDLIHLHCPFISAVLARTLRYSNKIPLVMTYHTKYDIDINKILALNPLRSVTVKFLMNNINACDEVWTVSEGAGENLRSLGYEGDYRIMENGTDFEKGRSGQMKINELRFRLGLLDKAPTYLYVGRMMWYKGHRIILDGLRKAKTEGHNFKMIFVGGGYDLEEIKEYAKLLDLEKECRFTGPVYDREKLRTYYSCANLFLFPSTYDTNGIVINEASACDLASVLVEGSCAAEKATKYGSAILIKEDASDLAAALLRYGNDFNYLKKLGEIAGDTLYLSWHDSVNIAYNRYNEICEDFVPVENRAFKPGIFFDNVQHIKDDLELRRSQIYKKSKEKFLAFKKRA